MWWYMLVILALVRLGQQDPCKFKTILGYEVSSSQPDLHSKTLSQNDDEKKKKKTPLRIIKHLALMCKH